MKHGFTLIEIIIVIIIVGILAAVGMTQYSSIVEKSRLAEAKIRLGTMHQLAHEYWLNNGTMTGIQDSDVGGDSNCTPKGYFKYWIGYVDSQYLYLGAMRCTDGGKTPNASREYWFYMHYWPGTGQIGWHCYYTDDSSSCFGYPT